jgi:RimJ/RimL family protein N-acetyltransferase
VDLESVISTSVDMGHVLEPAVPPANGGEPASRLTWIPIRALSTRHRDRILAHLLLLPERDRYLRFGYAASDSQITRYVDQLDFERDELLGIFNRRLKLLAMAHLAYLTTHDGKTASQAEFGVCVDARARQRGYATRLFELAVLHARNRGIRTLLIHALSENTAMLRIARRAGADVVRDGGESQACLELPPESLASHVEEIVEAGAGEMDYRFKQHARRMDHLLGSIAAIAGGDRGHRGD